MLTKEQLLAASEDEYMNEEQLAFFKNLIESQIAEIEQQIESAKTDLQTPQYEADTLDKAQLEEDRRLQLRFLERQNKLLPKLKNTIQRIDSGDFGFCEVTEEPIGIPRLLARPTATLCIEEKARQERQEKNFRDN